MRKYLNIFEKYIIFMNLNCGKNYTTITNVGKFKKKIVNVKNFEQKETIIRTILSF